MIDRRNFVLAMGATGLLAACQSTPKPSTVTVNLIGSAGANAGPDGGDRPVTVMLLRLKDAGKFNSADYFALQSSASGALGADLVGMDQATVSPGGRATKVLAFEAEAKSLGIVALYREPGGKTWRTTRAVPAKSKITLNVTLGRGGISVS